MAIHQFTRTDALAVLREMKRVARRIIIVDYGFPLRPGLLTWLTWIIEFIAGGDHFRNFKRYLRGGGIDPVIDEVVLTLAKRKVKGSGTIMISMCDY
jgi:demethylmenaquinone methyltransferase/2-methoxy-6-polyprenyl-1,4-benzoquinol methylase